jgi:hypothetical protein
MRAAIATYTSDLPRVYKHPTRNVCLPDEMFREMYAMAVIFVASGQGLIAIIRPMKKAATRGISLLPIASINDIRSLKLIHLSGMGPEFQSNRWYIHSHPQFYTKLQQGPVW